MIQNRLVIFLLYVLLEIDGRVLLGKWNDATVECASEYELTFKCISKQTNRSHTIAECDPMMSSCHILESSLGNKYNVSHTGRGGMLHITHLDKDTSGIYTCCETYNPAYSASINMSSHSVFLNDSSAATPMEKVNGKTIECSSSAEITFKYISRKTNTSRTIAECDVMMRSCHMFGANVNNKYTIAYTGQGGLLRIDSLDEETEGTYICCETYNPSNFVSTYFYIPYYSTDSMNYVTNGVPVIDQTTTANSSTPRQDRKANVWVIVLTICAALVIIVIGVIVIIKKYWGIRKNKNVRRLLAIFTFHVSIVN
ncbi:hypothetical protein DPMN_022909 [Dreissena polymorpha]|uniref:Ig-like domain-containing protein n=1 Tax=Dreissena polymorpha TaxID=45954 RepID=A0A9D4LJR5_DREPO|nr:hypothetical protein DPMN_022909 [Dreissena polymorpha]